jgi:uncharacterized membrane protein YbhN (UPF0104 family)
MAAIDYTRSLLPMHYTLPAVLSAGFSAAASALTAGAAGLGGVNRTLGVRTPDHWSVLILKGRGERLLTFWLLMGF